MTCWHNNTSTHLHGCDKSSKYRSLVVGRFTRSKSYFPEDGAREVELGGGTQGKGNLLRVNNYSDPPTSRPLALVALIRNQMCGPKSFIAIFCFIAGLIVSFVFIYLEGKLSVSVVCTIGCRIVYSTRCPFYSSITCTEGHWKLSSFFIVYWSSPRLVMSTPDTSHSIGVNHTVAGLLRSRF